MATLMTRRVPKNRVSRRYSGLRRRYQEVSSIAVRKARPIVTGTKKKWFTVTNANCHLARVSCTEALLSSPRDWRGGWLRRRLALRGRPGQGAGAHPEPLRD